jgi:hypothetical protein
MVEKYTEKQFLKKLEKGYWTTNSVEIGKQFMKNKREIIGLQEIETAVCITTYIDKEYVMQCILEYKLSRL